MASEIGNKGMLKSMAKALGILDVKLFPSRLATSEMVPTLMVHPGWGSYELWRTPAIVAGQDIEGVGAFVLPIVSPDPNQFPGGLGFPRYDQFCFNPGTDEVAILGGRILIYTDETGSSTMEGDQWSIRFLSGQDPFYTGEFDPFFVWVNGDTTNQWGFPYGIVCPPNLPTPIAFQSPIWVPSKTHWGVAINASAAAAPNTFVELEFWGVRTPKGVPLPGLL